MGTRSGGLSLSLSETQTQTTTKTLVPAYGSGGGSVLVPTSYQGFLSRVFSLGGVVLTLSSEKVGESTKRASESRGER